MSKNSKTALIVVIVLSIFFVAIWIYKTTRYEKVPVDTKGENAFNVKYGDKDKNQVFDFYTSGNETETLMVIVHGGGWTMGDKKQLSSISEFFAEQGYSVINMNYRLAPDWKYDAPLQDIASVLKLVNSNTSKYGLKNDYKIALLGHSAGAHLTALYSLKEADYDTKEINYEIGLAGPYDLEEIKDQPLISKAVDSFLDKTPRSEASAPNQVKTNESTKFLLFNGDQDALVPVFQMQNFEKALKDKNAYVETYVIPGRNHGSLISSIPQSGDEVGDRILNFLSPYNKISDTNEQLPKDSYKLGAGNYKFKIKTGDIERNYMAHVPASYKKSKETPMVMVFHGGLGTALSAVLLSRMNEKADKEDFIAIYPEGLDEGSELGAKSGIQGVWNAGDCCGTSSTNNVDDVGFVKKVLDDMESKFNIDTKRIYATGISNGGLFTQRLACDLSDRIAAFAPVAGGLAMEYNECIPLKAVPIIEFHALDDPTIYFTGGVSDISKSGYKHKPIPEVMDFWRKNNSCSESTEITYENKGAICKTYTGCKNEKEVTYCTTEDGGHSWPGGKGILKYQPSQDIDATNYMWDNFFKKYSL